MKNSSSVNIELTKDDALVLFDWLYELNENSDEYRAIIGSETAEQGAIWGLKCALEKILSEPFSNDYNDFVLEAKNNIIKFYGFGEIDR